jgi:hypothetical protein
MTKPKKLSIRIKFAAQVNNVVKEETVYLYYWSRIIASSVIALIALTALTVTGRAYFNQQQIQNKTVTPRPADMSIASVNIEQSTATQRAKRELAASLQTRKGKAPQIASPRASNSDVPKKDISITASKDTAPVPTQQVSSAAPLFVQSEVKIFSDQITRFVISKSVINNEPVGTISDIKFDANNIATLYAYSDAIGLKDEMFYYIWSLDGETIAKVRIGVWANRWRSYSRKFIQPSMHGEWQVALQNSEGKTLAISRFNY